MQIFFYALRPGFVKSQKLTRWVVANFAVQGLVDWWLWTTFGCVDWVTAQSFECGADMWLLFEPSAQTRCRVLPLALVLLRWLASPMRGALYRGTLPLGDGRRTGDVELLRSFERVGVQCRIPQRVRLLPSPLWDLTTLTWYCIAQTPRLPFYPVDPSAEAPGRGARVLRLPAAPRELADGHGPVHL